MTTKLLLIVGALLSSIYAQTPKWPLDPHRYPPSREETDRDDPDVPGWDGGQFEAAGVAWRALLSSSVRLTAEQRKMSNYYLHVIDRGALYHVHILPKPDSKKAGDLSLGSNRRGVAVMVVVYKHPLAAKYVLGQG